jgi:hypothetical protein
MMRDETYERCKYQIASLPTFNRIGIARDISAVGPKLRYVCGEEWKFKIVGRCEISAK